MVDLMRKQKLVMSVYAASGDKETKNRFLDRVEQGNLTKDTNETSHFCVYFAPYDSNLSEIYIGLHKKSGLWLFNGKHIDQGETPQQALGREIKEEWGPEVSVDLNLHPLMLTITNINNLPIQKCQEHFDLWYFIPVEKDTFKPDPDIIAKEFNETGWKTFSEAIGLVTDQNTLYGIKFIDEQLIKNPE